MCRHAAHTAAQRPKQMEKEEAAWAELGVERARSQPPAVWERLSPYKNHTGPHRANPVGLSQQMQKMRNTCAWKSGGHGALVASAKPLQGSIC